MVQLSTGQLYTIILKLTEIVDTCPECGRFACDSCIDLCRTITIASDEILSRAKASTKLSTDQRKSLQEAIGANEMLKETIRAGSSDVPPRPPSPEDSGDPATSS